MLPASKRYKTLLLWFLVGLSGVLSILVFISYQDFSRAEDPVSSSFSMFLPSLTGYENVARPQDIHFDSSGNYYVSDYDYVDTVKKYNSSGTLLLTIGEFGSGDGQFNRPTNIATDSGGNIYVIDSLNYRIQKFDSSGNFVLKWGSSGSGDGQMSNPTDIVISSEDVIYVADEGNNRIQRFDTNGTFLGKWGSVGSANGQFQDPNNLAIDSSDNIYVSESGNDRVQKFTSTGSYITRWGSAGSSNGQFNNPYGIHLDSSDNVYVLDELNHRIQKFTSTGTYLAQYSNLYPKFNTGSSHNYRNLTVDSFGNMYVVDPMYWFVWKFNSSGTYVESISARETIDGRFYSLRAMDTDSSGNIYTLDGSSGFARIQKFSSSGTFISKSGDLSGTGASQLDGTNFTMAVDNTDSYIYVSALSQNKIVKYTTSGSYVTSWGTSGSGNSQFSSPWGVGVDSNGFVYVMDKNNSRIQKFNSSGGYVTQWYAIGSGLAIDSNDVIYVMDGAGDKVRRYSNTGESLGYWGSSGTADGYLEGQTVIFTDLSNNVYVAGNKTSHIVQKFTSDGVFQDAWITKSDHPNSLFWISAGTVSADGTVLVSDSLLQKIVFMDIALPTSPANLVANPAIYTGTNSYSFSWDASVDNNAIGGYEYKLGTGEWIDNATTSVSNIMAYQEGENFFYVRAYDTSGNRSDSTVVSYYYDTISPVKAGGISVSPSSYSNVDTYDFSWGDYTDSGSGVDHYEYKTGSNDWISTSDTFVNDLNAYVQGQNTFYLRAVDALGNISAEETISYYYDLTAPDSVSNLLVTPSEYTKVDSFDFSWDESADSNEGTVIYEYKTGADSGEHALWQETTELTLENVPSYITGENVFYIRVKDGLGNTSVISSVSYYYDGALPTAPANIEVTSPTLSTVNSFSFSWDSSSDIGSGEVTYEYRLANTETWTPIVGTTISNIEAYMVGNNVLYLRSVDSVGNISEANSVTFTFNPVVEEEDLTNETDTTQDSTDSNEQEEPSVVEDAGTGDAVEQPPVVDTSVETTIEPEVREVTQEETLLLDGEEIVVEELFSETDEQFELPEGVEQITEQDGIEIEATIVGDTETVKTGVVVKGNTVYVKDIETLTISVPVSSVESVNSDIKGVTVEFGDITAEAVKDTKVNKYVAEIEIGEVKSTNTVVAKVITEYESGDRLIKGMHFVLEANVIQTAMIEARYIYGGVGFLFVIVLGYMTYKFDNKNYEVGVKRN